ncbi:hypothetical protein LUZ60_011726 [Juncus effusus]|nr:hypothetical protein LUZ60_011726 [Juncus effusus]
MPTKYSEVEELKRKNGELEREVRERREREGGLMADLKRMRERARLAEEAEERLCVQLGELEAEAVEQVLAYRKHIKVLADQLELVKRVMLRSDSNVSSVSSISSDSINGIAVSL